MPEIRLPKAFLQPLFQPDTKPVIATGFDYTPVEVAIHGVKTHNAIDFDVPRGTPVLAPADGYYVATYGELLLRNDDDTPRTLSLAEAKGGNSYNRDFRPPKSGTRWPIYFGSMVVQGWHPNGRYTQLAHLDYVDPAVRYYPPEAEENGDLKFHPILRAPTATYRRSGVASWLKAGTLLGVTGMTGCGWGERCYETAQFGKGDRPDFRQADYTYYTSPHLHFMVFGRRSTAKARPPLAFWDPFGIYKDITGGYPAESPISWHNMPSTLWVDTYPHKRSTVRYEGTYE
jgi:hypothetical protein